mgnify:CR=1 FL=1
MGEGVADGRKKHRGAAGAGARLRRTVAAPFGFLLIWFLVSEGMESVLLPGPIEVTRRFLELAVPTLLRHAGTSLIRVLAALAAAVVTALPLGIILGRNSRARSLFTPLVYVLYPVPKIALLPLLFLLVGVGEGSRIMLVWLVLFFQVLVAVRDAAASIPAEYHRSVQLLGGGRRAFTRFVILPAILPALITALRVGSGTALAVLFFAETFFTRWGLGIFIVDGWMKASYVDMTTGIVAIGLLGLILFALLDGAERLFCSWRR